MALTPEQHYREAGFRLELAETADNALRNPEAGDARQDIVYGFNRHMALAELHRKMAETGLAFQVDVVPAGSTQAPVERTYGFNLGTTATPMESGNWNYRVDFPGKDLTFIHTLPPQAKAFKARTFTDFAGRVGVDVRRDTDDSLIAEWIFG